MSIKTEQGKRGREGHALRNRPVDGLTAKRRKFIDEYMLDRNARAAARRAGYSATYAHAKAAQLLKVPDVGAEIDRRTNECVSRVGVKVDEVLRELKRIALFDVRGLFSPDGKLKTNPHEMTDEQAAALANFDIVVLNKEGDYILKFNPSSRIKALELLGKHAKMFTDKVEHTGAVVQYITDFGDGADAPDGGR